MSTAGPAGAAGELGGRVAGGVIGGVIGSFIPPPGLGTLLGRAVGSRLGGLAGRAAATALQDHINSMEEAEDEAEESDQATTAEEEAVCRECRERCQKIADDINRLMYRNKRGPGTQRGTHGLALRRAEQIRGEYGPGQVKMGYKIKNGVRVPDIKEPWQTHREEIQRQQDQLKKKINEYDSGDCNKHIPDAFNRQEADRMMETSFNPTPEEWLGPYHPLCDGLGEAIRQNSTPKLPRFLRAGQGSGTRGLMS
ncbi:hypothetical protein [Paracoccus tegillarcae]|uniref:hypothetical protein n=1 Tax=Paracoccus tegillarcae TaxID=1529068 RepID=UPI0013009844|nr:hypothetical protein [Paracoccus tegillarcae]